MTLRSSEPAPGLLRFSPGVRWVHGVVGLLVLVLVVTAAVLYNGSLAVRVGHRDLVRTAHLWSGWALVVPLLLGLLDRGYRADLHRLDRFTTDDRRWLRSRRRRDGSIPVGKFNAGQKLNTAVSGGALAVLLLTGSVMHATGLTPLAWRTGATFVHDWAALGLGLLVLGHLAHALGDGGAMLGIRTGRVTRVWAQRHHPLWVAELDQAVDQTRVDQAASGSDSSRREVLSDPRPEPE